MLFGVAIGDALGAPFEFRHSPRVTEYIGRIESHKIFLMKQYQGYFWSASGQVTDDTEMTMNLAMTLLKCGGVYNPVAALTSYLDWANGGCCFLGKNTRFLLKTPNKNRLAYYNRQIALQKKEPEASWPQSNGALMRCSPLAIISDD